MKSSLSLILVALLSYRERKRTGDRFAGGTWTRLAAWVRRYSYWFTYRVIFVAFFDNFAEHVKDGVVARIEPRWIALRSDEVEVVLRK